jgi:methyl-accepting chemotaxis protein
MSDIMKLAEALIERADVQKRIAQLRSRLARSAKVQEDETPPEDPQELLTQVNNALDRLQTLIQQINRTNAATQFDDERTLTDVLAERDVLMKRRGVLSGLIDSAIQQQPRYGRMEIKFYSTVDIAEIQTRIDDISRRYRELDTAIQQINWEVDLIDS